MCTGPSYKRGPPKGYIHAIEQRWHQVESLLGAILQCPDPRVKSVVADLKQDDLAREILDRVDMGPYVSDSLGFCFLVSPAQFPLSGTCRQTDAICRFDTGRLLRICAEEQ